MIDSETKLDLLCAIEHERDAAIENHGEFRNHHEAWAVLKEEIEEVLDEAEKTFSKVRINEMSLLWADIKADEVGREYSLKHIKDIRSKAVALAQECIQVAAVCDKWELLVNKEGAADGV